MNTQYIHFDFLDEVKELAMVSTATLLFAYLILTTPMVGGLLATGAIVALMHLCMDSHAKLGVQKRTLFPSHIYPKIEHVALGLMYVFMFVAVANLPAAVMLTAWLMILTQYFIYQQK